MTDEDSVRHTPWAVYLNHMCPGHAFIGTREHIMEDIPTFPIPTQRAKPTAYIFEHDFLEATAIRICEALNGAIKRADAAEASKIELAEYLDKTVAVAADAVNRADAADARLQRIAGIIEDVMERNTRAMSIPTAEELSKIYEYATLDRPVVDLLLVEARGELEQAILELEEAGKVLNGVDLGGMASLMTAATERKRAFLAKLDEALK